MLQPTTPRLALMVLMALASLGEALQQGWKSVHAGIATQHLLQCADLRGLANARSVLLMALFLPACMPQSLFGFVPGMSWTFCAFVAALTGGAIAGLCWTVHRLAGQVGLAW